MKDEAPLIFNAIEFRLLRTCTADRRDADGGDD